MAFCSACGTNLPDGARFCPACGAAVATTAAPPAGPSAVPPDPVPVPPSPVATPSARPAAAASSAGPVSPEQGSRAGGLILPLMIVVGIAVIILMIWSQRGDERQLATEESGEGAKAVGSAGGGEAEKEGSGASGSRTTASSLDSAFRSDPGGASARYPGPVTVTGTIASMVMPGATPAIALEGRTPLNFVVANFPSNYRDRLATLAKGDSVTLSCDSVKALAGTTLLQGCTLEG